MQQLDKQRVERRQARAQDERDSLRRFDDRFAAATKATVKHDREQRAGAAVELMSFLREENRGFHQQTYYYVLSYLKVSAAEPLIDQAFSRVFQRAAHLVLPELSAHEHRLAVDFSHARLSGVDLSGLELGEADLSRTVLRRANLAGCCLWRAHGMRTDLGGASLRHANLEEVVLLDGLDAVGADFSFANLVAARFAPRGAPGNAVLRGAHFVAARLQGACLNGADLRDGRFEGANLRGASLRGVLLNDAAVGSILRALNHTWRAAAWDPSVWRYLKAEARGAKLAPPPKRKPSDVPDPHYRRHPYPGHPDHVSRPRLVG